MDITEWYLRMHLFGKSKRMRKKAWKRCVETVGTDGEGLIRYDRIAGMLKRIRKQYKLRKEIVRGTKDEY